MQHFNENNATWLEETYQAGTTYQETPETWKPDLVAGAWKPTRLESGAGFSTTNVHIYREFTKSKSTKMQDVKKV